MTDLLPNLLNNSETLRASVSAGFEDLSIALVLFLWHLSLNSLMRNGIDGFFFFFVLLDHISTCAYRKYCHLIVLLGHYFHGFIESEIIYFQLNNQITFIARIFNDLYS